MNFPSSPWLRRLAAVLLFAVLVPAWSQTTPAIPLAVTPPPLPPLPVSPVSTFRDLLARTPAERASSLAQRPPRQREFLEARLTEYEAMPAAEREDRLRATDLYWHLQQLVRRAPAERTNLLATVPVELKSVLAERLELWDQLPAADRDALLEHERTIRYLARLRASRPPPLPPVPTVAGMSASPPVPLSVQADLSRFSKLSGPELSRVHEQWRRFFESPSPRQERALQTMTEAERGEMQQVLERFRRLTPQQRQTCVATFTRFAGMPPAERVEFLRRAERWEAMPAAERDTWRRIVNKLPIYPPLPVDPSAPPLPTAVSRRPLFTNAQAQ